MRFYRGVQPERLKRKWQERWKTTQKGPFLGGFAYERLIKSLAWTTLQYLVLVGLFLLSSTHLHNVAHHNHALWFSLPAPYQSPFLRPFIRWDSFWYNQLALQGYKAHPLGTAFWPLYPWLLRVALHFGVPIAIADAGIPFLATWGLIYVGSLWAERVGVKGFTFVRYLLFFPSSFFLFAAYPTSLFLFFTLLYFWSWEAEKPFLGFVAGLLAALSWNTGLFLAAPLLLTRKFRRSFQINFLYFILGPALGIGVYLTYLWARFRNPFYFMVAVKKGWGRTFVPPWLSLYHTLLSALHHAPHWVWVDLLLTLIALFLAVLLFVVKGLTPDYLFWAWFSLLLPMSSVIPTSPSWLLSMPRFLLPAFPIFWVLARLEMRYPRSMPVLSVGFAILQAGLFSLYAHWYWVA